jgi:uncharacterized protein (TIGR03067 family)
MKWQLLAVVATSLLLAADAPKDDATKKKEVDKLQGAWKVSRWDSGGNSLPDEALKQMKFNIKGDKYTFEFADMKEEGTMTLDPSKNPATIDLKIEEGNDKGKTQVGIYKLEKDTIKLCLAPAGSKDRPKEFASKEDSENIFIVIQRELQ